MKRMFSQAARHRDGPGAHFERRHKMLPSTPFTVSDPPEGGTSASKSAAVLAGMPWGFVPTLTVLLVFTFGLAQPEGWDDSFYVAQMTSLIGDGDLLLQDDLLAFQSQDDALRLRALLFIAPDGGVANMFGIGPAVLHSAYLWPSLRSSPELGQSFRIRIGLASMALLVLVALSIRTLLVRLEFGEGMASLCALGSVYWGPLAVYGTRLYLNSHLPSALCASLAALLCWDWAQRGGAGRAALIGFFCGLAAVVRFQDVLLGVTLAPFLLLTAERRTAGRRRAGLELALAGGVFVLVVAIQALALQRQSCLVWGIPQGSGFMRWTHPQLGLFFLSPYHGLLPWTPAFGVGLLALLLALWRARDRQRRVFIACLLVWVAAECYVSAATWDWAGGSAFGARRLSSVSVVAALGLATLLSSARRLVLVSFVGLASAWALVAASLFLADIDDLGVLARGGPSAENPLAIEYPAPDRLVRPDLGRFVRGTFSLVEPTRPSLPHRAFGLALCVVICAGGVLGWRAVRRCPRFPTVIATACVGWACFWWLLVWRAPPNTAANRIWGQVVAGTASTQDLEALPPEIAAAARVVLSWKALRRGQLESGRRLLSEARSPQFLPPNLVDLALLDEALPGRPGR